MDNQKKSNQAKFNRSKRKKEHFSKGGKNHSSPATDSEKRQQQRDDEKSKQRKDKCAPANTSLISEACDKTSKTELTDEQKLVLANLKKETEEISNLTQKYSRRSIISTWTRDFEIPQTQDAENDEGADFKELSSSYSTDFVGRHFMLKEEREWLNQSESCETPFSLDLKNLETGISCIPFFKRHDLTEKSFNPKEIQLMISEAKENEVVYRGMKNAASETEKVLLNEQNRNPDDFISKDFIDDNAILVINKDSKPSDDVSEANIALASISRNLNNEFIKSQVDIDNSSITSNVNSKKNINKCITSSHKFNYDKSSLSSSTEVRDEPTITSFEPRSQRPSRSRLDNDSQYCSFETSKVDISAKVKTEKSADTGFTDFAIQSLEPRGPRRPRGEAIQSDIEMNNVEVEGNGSNFPEYSFIGLNPRSKKLADNFDVDKKLKRNDAAYNDLRMETEGNIEKRVESDAKTDDNFWNASFDLEKSGRSSQRRSPCNDTTGDLNLVSNQELADDYVSSHRERKELLMKTERDSYCEELNTLPNSSKNSSFSVDYSKEIELNLSGLTRSNNPSEIGELIDSEINNSIVKTENHNKLENLKSDIPLNNSIKIESKTSVENISDKSGTGFVINEGKSVKATKEFVSPSYDDDLDFLLGIVEPSADNISFQKTNDSVSSNLSILQTKLEGGVVESETHETLSITKPINGKPSSPLVTSKRNEKPAEDLDEWLDSVLDS